MINNDQNLSLFDAKSMYLIEHNKRGRSIRLLMKPSRVQRKQIYDNMHLIGNMSFTPIEGFPIMQAYNKQTNFVYVPFTDRKKYVGDCFAIHFFLDDYKFRYNIWHHLEYLTTSLAQYGCILTPDLSLWRDYPTEYYNKQNVFRTRFVGAYWQSCGFDVIPTASWGGLNSFKYCFEGLPTDSVIAVSGMGNRKDTQSYNLWCYGLRRLEEEKHPSLILVYGEEIEVDGLQTPIQFIPDYISSKLRKIKKNGK